MRRALLLGGTGQIGRAAGRLLAENGWEVAIASRSGSLPAGVEGRALRIDRSVAGELEAAVGDGVDLLVDIVAFTAAHGEQLNALAGRVGSLVVISSASVYVDPHGLTLDEADGVDTFPRFPVPIPEEQPTVRPGDETYSTRKAALEQTVLGGPLPATVVRPCAVHGPGSELPRELFFVKRILDGRSHVALVSNGESRFHTTSVANLAELVRLAGEQPGSRVLNCGDPEPPSVLEICNAIGTLEPVLVPESGYERRELSNPWAVPFPLVVDMAAAERELGYRPVMTYAAAVAETRDWLVAEGVRPNDYLARFFDYDAEDAAITAQEV